MNARTYLFMVLFLLVGLNPSAAAWQETQSEESFLGIKEVVELHPSAYGMPSVGIPRFSRYGFTFSIDIRGFREIGIDDGPYMVEPPGAILGTFAARLPAATGSPITELDAYVIVKDPPLIEGKLPKTIDQLIHHLTKGEPDAKLAEIINHYRQLRQAGNLMDALPFQSRNIRGTILCDTQEVQTSTPEGASTMVSPKTKWHFDFISLIQQRWLQVQFSIMCPPGTPRPEGVLKRVQTILATIRFHAPLTSSLQALEIAKAHLEATRTDTTWHDMEKPEKVQEIRMDGRKAWRVSWRRKDFTGKGGQLVVIVKGDGNCQLGWGE